MRIANPIGLAAAAVLVGASLAPASSTVVRPVSHSQILNPHQRLAQLTSLARVGVLPNLRHPFIANKKGAGSVYVSDAGAGAVYGYAATGGSPTFTVSGLSEPQGMASTKKNIYVANTEGFAINVYTPPSTTATVVPDSGGYPAGVAVNKKGTTIWLTNIISTSDGEGNLQEYSSSGTLEQTIVCSDIYRYYFVAVDKAGNVAVDGSDESGFPHVDYIPAGSSSCSTTTISVEFPGGVNFTTKGDLAVGDQDANTVTVYKAPAFSSIVSTTDLGGGISDPVTFAFSKKDATVWTANAGSANLTEFAFPAGGSPTVTISGLEEPIGVAVQPPAKAK